MKHSFTFLCIIHYFVCHLSSNMLSPKLFNSLRGSVNVAEKTPGQLLDIADQVERLGELHEKGLLSEKEFVTAKQLMLCRDTCFGSKVSSEKGSCSVSVSSRAKQFFVPRRTSIWEAHVQKAQFWRGMVHPYRIAVPTLRRVATFPLRNIGWYRSQPPEDAGARRTRLCMERSAQMRRLPGVP